MIDQAQLDAQTLGDAELAGEVLDLFAAQLVSARSALERADERELRSFAHALKGTARSLGVTEIANFASELERRPDDIALRKRFALLHERFTVELAGRSRKRVDTVTPRFM